MFALAWKRDASAPGAGQVERHARQHEPGAVGVEPAGGQVRERPVLKVGDDLLDDRVAAVIGFGLDQCQGRGGEYRVVAPCREQLVDAGVAVAAPCLVYP